ncbi:Inner spore coat protein D [Paraliobacillus sp. PM-2]|uniref:CotD family spore coat protein n=1 Tax=Paraliobacillus sp. PM-2 TaxID=1462524 RepID=UPI00061BAE97|nr:CotD family spore coat protein [Paraliobacillus sp. PM-2]CQR46655.1 Inner spore coat protein D [Paraliobacillus sp. PM-2]
MRPRRHCCMQGPTKTVVCPTKYNQMHTCSQSNVNYIHPSHTNVVNHHLVKNTHFYPHTTSYQNTVDMVNVYGGSSQVPNQQQQSPFFR